MGYQSDVGLVLSKDGVKFLIKSLDDISNSSIRQDVLTLLSEYADEHYIHVDGTEMWIWNGIKWYPDYDSVSFIENFTSHIPSEQFLLVRIGEAQDDVESEGTFWDNPFDMGISRTITFTVNTD